VERRQGKSVGTRRAFDLEEDQRSKQRKFNLHYHSYQLVTSRELNSSNVHRLAVLSVSLSARKFYMQTLYNTQLLSLFNRAGSRQSRQLHNSPHRKFHYNFPSRRSQFLWRARSQSTTIVIIPEVIYWRGSALFASRNRGSAVKTSEHLLENINAERRKLGNCMHAEKESKTDGCYDSDGGGVAEELAHMKACCRTANRKKAIILTVFPSLRVHF